ncbi:MCE family protein [Candidatus Fermentibacteria bacterium]|nr:MCE family protein [Candidatus Fermentibacteria bacterium]
MSLEANRFRLGVFFFLGAVLIVAVLVWLTGWFRGKASREYVCYFSESVQGLENGTAVRYNGVPVGMVQSIAVAPDGRLVEVLVTIETVFPVEEDLAARLDFVGITGVRVINLRTVQEGEARLPPLSFKPDHPVIPVVESQLEKLDMGLEGLLRIMGEVDFARISDTAVSLLENLDRLAAGGWVESLTAQMGRTARTADSLMVDFRQVAQRLNRLAVRAEAEAGPFSDSVRSLVVQIEALTESMARVPMSLDQITGEATLLLRELRSTLDRLGASSSSLAPSGEDKWP